MVLVWIIADMIAASAAGFAVTSFTGEHAHHPEPVPRRTDVLSGGIHGRRTWRPRRIWLRVLLLLGCLPERVLLSERSSVIVPGHVTVGERVRIRIGACRPVAVRVAQPPLVRLSVFVPDLGLAHIRVSGADADHIGIGLAEHTSVFGTRDRS